MRYWKIHQGKQNMYASIAVEGGFVGLDHGMPNLSKFDVNDLNLKEKLKEVYRENHLNPNNKSIASGVGNIFRLLNIFQEGDAVITPLGDGTYKVGKITGGYFYAGADQVIPHRRPVQWFGVLDKKNISQSLANTFGSIGTISDVTHQSVEIDALLSGDSFRLESVQLSVDQSEFALEKHLEDFLIENWEKSDIGKQYDLYKNDDGIVEAQQYQTDVGPIDILAIKKDGSEILVIELKKGRSGDAVVGQTLRYITAIKKEFAEPGQSVKGLIITGSDDQKIRYSIEPLGGLIEFMVYSIQFSLKKII